MTRAVLLDCLPWLGLLVVLSACLRWVVWVNRARFDWRRLGRLHRDQVGSVQSLSFVLTLPLFVMIVMFIVQVSQLMIGTIVVHYAAFAAARSAVVWIPARLAGGEEGENRISWYYADQEARDQAAPILNPESEDYGPMEGGVTYVVAPGSPKYQKIASAAVLACMAVAPSRDLGLQVPAQASLAPGVLQEAYRQMVPEADLNSRIPKRLENKLAYSAIATTVEIRFFHSNAEPPLVTYGLEDDVAEFYFNEIGWQDPITVTVTHQLALLPGPGRLLARTARRPDGRPDEVQAAISRQNGVYVYPLTASATLGNEGEKSVIRYVYYAY